MELGTVQVAPKGHSVTPDVAQIGQAEDLVSAAVGEDRSLPPGELVDPPQGLDKLYPRPHAEVVEVRQHDGGTCRLEIDRRESLDRAESSDRHERRRLDDSVW